MSPRPPDVQGNLCGCVPLTLIPMASRTLLALRPSLLDRCTPNSAALKGFVTDSSVLANLPVEIESMGRP
jgi:hypothetical protein